MFASARFKSEPTPVCCVPKQFCELCYLRELGTCRWQFLKTQQVYAVKRLSGDVLNNHGHLFENEIGDLQLTQNTASLVLSSCTRPCTDWMATDTWCWSTSLWLGNGNSVPSQSASTTHDLLAFHSKGSVLLSLHGCVSLPTSAAIFPA